MPVPAQAFFVCQDWNRIHSSVFLASFPFTSTMYIPQHMPVFSGFICSSRNRYTPFCASVDASMLAQYIFHAYLFVNPKRELEFKMFVTVELQDISSIIKELSQRRPLEYQWRPLSLSLLGSTLAKSSQLNSQIVNIYII